jgi:hypothetical protein
MPAIQASWAIVPRGAVHAPPAGDWNRLGVFLEGRMSALAGPHSAREKRICRKADSYQLIAVSI